MRRGFRARRGPRLSPEPKNLLSIARELPAWAWKRTTWRQGTKGPQRSRFARLPVWAAHGWKQGPQPERVEETVLIEWPADEPAPTRLLAGTPAQAKGGFGQARRHRQGRVGASSRTTVNSKMNSGWTTSKGAPGRASTTTSPWSPPPSSSCARSNDVYIAAHKHGVSQFSRKRLMSKTAFCKSPRAQAKFLSSSQALRFQSRFAGQSDRPACPRTAPRPARPRPQRIFPAFITPKSVPAAWLRARDECCCDRIKATQAIMRLHSLQNPPPSLILFSSSGLALMPKHLRERNTVIEANNVEDGSHVFAQGGEGGVSSGGKPVVLDQPPERFDAVEVRGSRAAGRTGAGRAAATRSVWL